MALDHPVENNFGYLTPLLKHKSIGLGYSHSITGLLWTIEAK